MEELKTVGQPQDVGALALETSEALSSETHTIVEGVEHDHAHHEIPRKTINPEQFLTMLRGMLIDEKISLRQARELRRQFGITNAYFTKKKVSNEQKKRKRAMAAMSRKRNRHNGSTKGQKRNSGHTISSAR